MTANDNRRRLAALEAARGAARAADDGWTLEKWRAARAAEAAVTLEHGPAAGLAWRMANVLPQFPPARRAAMAEVWAAALETEKLCGLWPDVEGDA